MPAYNAENFIKRAINSVFSQSYNNFELIIVDDGSTDSTVDIVNSFGDKVCLIQQQNAGASAARNTAIKSAKGEYIAFLDADDEWHKQKLTIQCQAMEANPHWIASYTGIFDTQDISSCSKEKPLFKDKTLKKIFINPYLTTSTFLISTHFIKELGGFDINLKTAEDLDLYLKTSAKGIIGEISTKLVWKHVIEGSLGSIMSSYEDNLFVVDKFFKEQDIKLTIDLHKEKKQIQAFIYESWGCDLLWKNLPSEAFEVLIQSLKLKINIKVCFLLFKCVVKMLIKKQK